MEQINENTKLISVSWNNYSSALIDNLSNFLQRESYCDATLICESRHIKVHRVILSSCSIYFREIFDSIFCTHPFIVLKDIRLTELEALVDFMYKGEVNIYKSRLKKLVKAAEYLKVKGLGISAEEPAPPSIKISNIFDDKDNALCDDVTSSALLKDQHESSERKSNNSDDDSSQSSKSKKRKESKVNSTQKKCKRIMTIDPKMDFEKDKRDFSVDPVVVLEKNIKSDVANFSKLSCQDSSGFNNTNNYDYEHFAKENHTVDLVSDNDEGFTHKSAAVSKSFSHSEDSYNMDENFHKCPHCPFSTNSSTELVTHGKIHTLPKKTLRCGLCTYKTHKKELLQKHIVNHSTNKLFKCKKCPFRTSLNIRLKKHVEKDCKGKQIKVKNNFSFPTAKTSVPLQGYSELVSRKDPDKSIEALASRIAPQDNADIILSQSYQENTASSSLLNLETTANNLPPNLDENVSNFSLDLEKPTKDISPKVLLEKEYFLCAFCPHKTAKKSLLASHVAQNHLM